MEVPPNTVKALYDLHKNTVQQLQKHGFTYEEAFWIDFATLSLYQWDDKAKVRIKLSEIFRLYLTIYYEKIDTKMGFEDEPRFLDLLKEKYDLINEAFFEWDAQTAGLQLGRVALGDLTGNPYLWTKAGIYILSMANEALETPIRMKLVKDL